MKAKRHTVKQHTNRLELLVWPGLAWIAAWSFAIAPPSASSEKSKKKRRSRPAATVIAFPAHRVTQRTLQAIEAKVIALPKSA